MPAQRERAFTDALASDLGRPSVDAWLADLAPTAAESRYARRHLRRWMRRRRTGLPPSVLPGRAHYEPLGVVPVLGVDGTGVYHGRFGFETISHRRPVLRKPVRPDPGFVHPPYDARTERLLRKIF